MANHAYVTSRRWFKPDVVEREIREILKSIDVWGVVELSRDDKWFEVKLDQEYLSLWVETNRKLEFRHPRNHFLYWIMCVLQNEFAYKYDGWISDEGLGDERWRGEKNKYSTYEEFLKPTLKGYETLPKPLRNKMIDLYVKYDPRNRK